LDSDTAALRDMWYFALPGHALRRGRMLARTFLGEPVLLGRAADGAPFALRNVCPHRGIPLSYGAFDGREVECCYHGWRFNTAGRCTAIPSLVEGQKLTLDKIGVAAYPAREIQGNVWLFFGDDPDTAPPPPAIPEIGDAVPKLFERMRVPAAIDHAVVGLMDPAHGAFVHRAWWWRSRDSIHEKAKAFAASPFGFTMLRHAPSSNANAYRLLGGAPETEITFRLPSTRIEHIRVGKRYVASLTAVTPLSETETEVNHAIYWDAPWLSALKPALRPYVRAFLNQDRRVMVMQSEGLKHNPSLMLINDADTQAKWYYRLKQEYRRARSTGRGFVNPVKGRVLRWRS
jgi:phenylpropionate dioxygenase-like ring-hydroxylating dioxygenase large terminal subunit